MTTDKQTLLPCPFCGCAIKLEVDADGPDYEFGDGGWVTFTLTGMHDTECPLSTVEDWGPSYTDEDGRTPADVIKAWNTRPDAALAQKAGMLDTACNMLKRLGMAWDQHNETIKFSVDGIDFCWGDPDRIGLLKFRRFLEDTLSFLGSAVLPSTPPCDRNAVVQEFVDRVGESVTHMKLTPSKREFAKAVLKSALEYALKSPRTDGREG